VGASKNRSTVKGRRFPKITHKTLPRAIENLADLFISQGMHDLWAHSEAVARFARELAPLAGIDPERAYAAGLLHDIGRLALAKFPVTQKNMEQEWLAAGFPLVYAETLAYGRDHTAIGAECLCAWEVHPAIIEAVRLHHRPGRSGSGLSGLLTLAEDLAARGSGTGSEDLWAGMRRALACVQTGILPDELDDIGVGRLLLSAAKPLVSGAGA
jgi:putative nucleotidyltransferase with HDIG domain